MAPPKLLRTYSRGNNSSMNCMDAMNILFAKNLIERKLHSKIRKGKNKLQIKELPKKIKTVLSDESSLHINMNDTFDHLLKGTHTTVRSTNNMSVKIIAKDKSTSVTKHFNKLDNISSRSSPIVSKLRSFKSRSQNSDNSLSWFKQPTPPGVNITNNLEIDKKEMSNQKVNNSKKLTSKQNSSRDSPVLLRSRGKLPDIVITNASGHIKDTSKSKVATEINKSNKKKMESSNIESDLSYNPIFTNSVREKILMHSSTPVLSNKTMRFVKQPISPIKTVDETVDVNEEINNTILKSLEEIKSWDKKFPSIDLQSNKCDSLTKIEDFRGFGIQEKGGASSQPDIKKESFITVRGRKMNRTTLDLEKIPNKSRSFNLDKFELFFNKFKTRSFRLDDFEQFHNSITQKLTGSLTQSQVNTLNSISLKDFESFYTAYQNKISMSDSSFLVKSNRKVNYVTNRKQRLSLTKNSVNLSKKYLKLTKQFDLKNLVVVLDNILVKNKTDKLKQSKSLCQMAVMNSIIQKQPVVNLARLSIKPLKEPSFKAKHKISLNGYKACRKFSFNCTPKKSHKFDNSTLPSSEFFDLGELFIDITRMPLNVGKLNSKITDFKDNTTAKKKERNFKKPPKNSYDKFKENELDNNRMLGRENEKSIIRNSKKSYESRKSSMIDFGKNSFSSPDHKSFKLADSKSSESLSNSGQVRKLKSASAERKSMPVDYIEVHSDYERTGIQLSLISEPLKIATKKKGNGKKSYVAKILVDSVSDTEYELKNTNNSVIREIGKSLRRWSQENIPSDSANASEVLSFSKKWKTSKVLRSHNNIAVDPSLEKIKTHLHKPSPKDLAREVNLRLSKAYQPDDSITYRAQDISRSILFSKHTELPSSPPFRLKDIVVNLTLHKFLGKSNDVSENVGVAPKTTKVTRQSRNERNNLSSKKTENKTSKNSRNLSTSVSLIDVSVNNTPKNQVTSRRSTKKSSNSENLVDLSKSNSIDGDIIESSITTPNVYCFKAPLAISKWKQRIPNLKAGKSWRRSLLVHKRNSVIDLTQDLENATSRSTSSTRQDSLVPQNPPVKRQSIKIVPLCDPRLSRRKTVLQTYAQTNLSFILDDSVPEVINLTPKTCKLSLDKSLPLITAKDIVLKRCGQTNPQPFEKLYPKSLLKDCKKIGEGVYGEVFLYTNPTGDTTVMKVIPIEGDKIVNQERQKKFDEILSEIIIASELSKLRKSTTNQTSAFSEVQRICCVKGKYPKSLLDLWNAYDSSKGSENDNPKIFEDDQLYIVLDLANGGRDLEAFVFNNAVQAVSMFKQVACALAVAEQQLQFEHRDLHWGNVLLKSVDKNKRVLCKHKGQTIESLTQGVEVTIIDFTLSRIVHDGVVIFNDLGQDPDLFVAEGDYQFEIYRLMREKNSNNWQIFEPYTNVLWLHYIIEKSITALRYKNTKTRVHKKNIDCLKEYEKVILNFKSVSEFVSQYY